MSLADLFQPPPAINPQGRLVNNFSRWDRPIRRNRKPPSGAAAAWIGMLPATILYMARSLNVSERLIRMYVSDAVSKGFVKQSGFGLGAIGKGAEKQRKMWDKA